MYFVYCCSYAKIVHMHICIVVAHQIVVVKALWRYSKQNCRNIQFVFCHFSYFEFVWGTNVRHDRFGCKPDQCCSQTRYFRNTLYIYRRRRFFLKGRSNIIDCQWDRFGVHSGRSQRSYLREREGRGRDYVLKITFCTVISIQNGEWKAYNGWYNRKAGEKEKNRNSENEKNIDCREQKENSIREHRWKAVDEDEKNERRKE